MAAVASAQLLSARPSLAVSHKRVSGKQHDPDTWV
jgi:hypothetical protein